MSILDMIHKKKAPAVEAHGLGDKDMLQENIVANEGEQDNVHTLFSEREMNKAKRLLERLVSRGKNSVHSEVIAVTPELAGLILQRNPEDENRKLSNAVVDKYASDMIGGRWNGLNGQTIVLCRDGYLNDGQHRLNAIIKANLTIVLTLVVGVERDSRLTLDQNKIRSNGDYLHMTGIKNANNVATVARLLMAYETNNMSTGGGRVSAFRSGAPTKAEVHEYAMKHLGEIERAFEFIGYNWKELPCTPTHIVAAKLIMDWQAKDKEEVGAFITQVCFGEGISRTSPAYHVRNRIQNERLAGTLRAPLTLEAIFRGWNALRRNGRMTRLALTHELPEIEA